MTMTARMRVFCESGHRAGSSPDREGGALANRVRGCGGDDGGEYEEHGDAEGEPGAACGAAATWRRWACSPMAPCTRRLYTDGGARRSLRIGWGAWRGQVSAIASAMWSYPPGDPGGSDGHPWHRQASQKPGQPVAEAAPGAVLLHVSRSRSEEGMPYRPVWNTEMVQSARRSPTFSPKQRRPGSTTQRQVRACASEKAVRRWLRTMMKETIDPRYWSLWRGDRPWLHRSQRGW